VNAFLVLNPMSMKISLPVAVCALAFCVLNSRADETYLHFDLGPAFIQDAAIKSGPDQAFKPGIRGDVAFGYNINDQWAAEIEGGVIWNSLDTIGGVSISPRTIDFYQYPILVNALYKFPTDNRWSPYFGAGVGGIATHVHATSPGFAATDFTFGYQIQAGLRYSVTPGVMIDFGYKFLGSMDHKWTNGGTTETNPFYTHAIGFSFSWEF
jgi:opacity protein-like surface antigen